MLRFWGVLALTGLAVVTALVKSSAAGVHLMSADEPIPEYDPSEDGGTGSPLADALNNFFGAFPVLHDPVEVQAFMESVEGLPDATERIEQFMQDISARYEKWAKDHRGKRD